MISLRFVIWLVLVSATFHVDIQCIEVSHHNSLRRNYYRKESFETKNNERHLQGYIVTLRLYNTVTNTTVTDLVQNQVVNIGRTPPGSLTIQAIGEGFTASSARLILSGAVGIRVTEGAPYFTLCENVKEKFFPCRGLKLGKYKIQVEFYSRSNRQGTLITTKSIEFEIISVPAQIPIKVPLRSTKAPSNKPILATKITLSLAPIPPTSTPSLGQVKIQTLAPIIKPTINPIAKPAIELINPPISVFSVAPTNQLTTATKVIPSLAPTNNNQSIAPNNNINLEPNLWPTKTPDAAAPVFSSTSAPSSSSCTIPKFVGYWEKWEKYPINVAESMGAMIGDDFVIVSGFTNSWYSVTTKVYSYNVRDANATWRQMDDVPVPGFHHAAYAVDGLIMYICGAYVGGIDNIIDSPVCLKYSHIAPIGQQWTRLPDLPSNRGGGGMNLIFETNSLVYATGASRKGRLAADHNTTFELSLTNLTAGWSVRSSIPYKANHVSHVTAYYKGKPHYFVGGGQIEEKELDGNQADLVEWDVASSRWIRRSNMDLPRGHASSSTIAYGCGFLIIGGAVNGGSKTSDISYYAIDTNSWIKIGDLPAKINSPVCDIVSNLLGSDWVYCQSGYYWGSFSWRRRITL